MCHARSLELPDCMLFASLSHFSCSRHLEVWRLLGAWGLKTLTSKKASCRLSLQNPCALMSSLTSSCVSRCTSRTSPQREGCSLGPIPTLGHASVRSFEMSAFVVSQEAESSRITSQGMFHCFYIHTSQAVDIRLPTKP